MKTLTVEVGGRDLNVLPASLKTIKRWLKAQTETRVGTHEYMVEVSDFIFNTLKKGNPGLEQDWLDDELTELSIPKVIRAIYEAGRIESGEQEGPAGS
jgi:hypothetical protein